MTNLTYHHFVFQNYSEGNLAYPKVLVIAHSFKSAKAKLLEIVKGYPVDCDFRLLEIYENWMPPGTLPAEILGEALKESMKDKI